MPNRRRLRFALRFAILLALLAAGSVAIVHAWQAWRLERAKAAYEAHGLPLGDPETALKRLYPPVPDDQNGARYILEAEALLRAAPPQPGFGSRLGDAPAPSETDAPLAPERLLDDVPAQAYAMVRKGVARDHVRYPSAWFAGPAEAGLALAEFLDLRPMRKRYRSLEGSAAFLPNGVDTRPVRVSYLLIDALEEAKQYRDARTFLEAFQLSLAIARSAAATPCADWHRLSDTLVVQSCRLLTDALNTVQFDERTLEMFATELDQAPVLSHHSRGLQFAVLRKFKAWSNENRAYWWNEWQAVANDLKYNPATLRLSRNDPFDIIMTFAEGMPWLFHVMNLYDAGRAAYLEHLNTLIDVTKTVTDPSASYKRVTAISQALPGTYSADSAFAWRHIHDAVSELQSHTENVYSILQETRIRLALERCRRAQGKYPHSLDALVPEYLATVPINPATGKRLAHPLPPGAAPRGSGTLPQDPEENARR